MSFEALDWIMFEIWRRPWRKHIWSRSNLPVGEKYKIPLSDYKWAHWVWSTTSDRDLALQGRTQISSKMPSSDNNSSAHSSSPGSPGRGSICTTMTQVTNEQNHHGERGEEYLVIKGWSRRDSRLTSGQLLVFIHWLQSWKLQAIGGKTYGSDL